MHLFIFVAFIAFGYALDNGLGSTPQMGWNSWNKFNCDINEKLIMETIDAMVTSGLRDVGYNYVNLDDCWQVSRDANDVIVADPVNFPHGIKYLADYAHSKGMKLGIYSDAGNYTCQHRPGSLGYEEIDARTYASWEIDYLKYDNCYNNNIDPRIRYPPMRDALNKTGRAIFFSMCEWGEYEVATWARDVGNSWRTTGDIWCDFDSMYNIAISNDQWWSYAGPGGWNDPDMLEVGNGMGEELDKTHFALWCIVKAPLILGHDVRKENSTVVMNTELIAINQDKLGRQGRRLSVSETVDIWGGELSPLGTNYVALLVNKDKVLKRTVTLSFALLGIQSFTPMILYDLWAHEQIGVFTVSYTVRLEPMTSLAIKLTKRFA